jgi:hypothetical protein
VIKDFKTFLKQQAQHDCVGNIKKARKELQLMKMATNNGGSYECDQNSRMGMYKLDKIRSEVPKSAL